MDNSINSKFNTPVNRVFSENSNGNKHVTDYKTSRFDDYIRDFDAVIRKPAMYDEFEYQSEVQKRKHLSQRNKLKLFKHRAAAAAAAVIIMAGGVGVTGNTISAKSNNETPFVELNDEETAVIEKFGIASDVDEDISDVAEIIEEAVEEVMEEVIISQEAEEAYENLSYAIETFSSDMGIDGLELIKERVDVIGEGEVDVIDILKILCIESNGRVYDASGEILSSYTGEAFDPFQLTPDTVDYLNYYYGLAGTENELDVMNPYDNLDACIYNVKFLKEKKENDLNENGIFATGSDDLMEAVFWCYHDGAWAESVTEQGQNYIEKYRELSAIDDYPELAADILEGNLA